MGGVTAGRLPICRARKIHFFIQIKRLKKAIRNQERDHSKN